VSEHHWLRACGSWKYGRLGYECCYSEGKVAVSVYNFTSCKLIFDQIRSVLCWTFTFNTRLLLLRVISNAVLYCVVLQSKVCLQCFYIIGRTLTTMSSLWKSPFQQSKDFLGHLCRTVA